MTSDSDKIKPRGYRDLLVWQKGIALVKTIYNLTYNFPSEEKFGLNFSNAAVCGICPFEYRRGPSAQINPGIHTVHSNAEGSLAELDTQLVLSQELNLINTIDALKLTTEIDELRRMLNSLRRCLAEARAK